MKSKNGKQSQKSRITTEIIKTSLSRIEAVDGVPVALIFPAGITQNTKVLYAAGFKQLESTALKHLVLIGENDPKDRSGKILIQSKGQLNTLLGKIEADTFLAQKLIDIFPNQIQPEDPEAFAQFNPILPFIKHVCPSAMVLPILLDPGDIDSALKISTTIAKNLNDGSIGVIAFSNLDDATLSAIEFCDIKVFLDSIPNLQKRPPGEAIVSYSPLTAALNFALEMNSNILSILKSFSDIDPDSKAKTHQASIMLWQYNPPDLSSALQKELIILAKNAIHSYILKREVPGYLPENPALLRKSGVFVTLRQNNSLRGCIGRMQADLPLYTAVQEMAIAAATADPRFPPIKAEELDQLTFKIAVLSPLKRITAEQVDIGKHGLLISHQGRRGVLLPEVPVERGWNREMFLANLCMKASLPTRVLEENPALYAFTAVEFGS